MVRSAVAEAKAAVTARPAVLQRKCTCAITAGFQDDCEECRKNRSARRPGSAASLGSGVAPPVVHEVLNAHGRPLDAATRAYFEPRLGADFSQVRIHDDARAADSAAELEASAYTLGRDISFAAGLYAPQSVAGRRLLAHELTHVVQQGQAPTAGAPTRVIDPADPTEREAERVAETIASGGYERVRTGARGESQIARLPAERGGVPCASDAYRAELRDVALQPVFFRSSATDISPTGTSWPTRFAAANRIWGKLGVTFTAASPTVLTDASNKTAGASDQEIIGVMGLATGAGVEIFVVDNAIAHQGGAATANAGSAAAQSVISDGGTSDTLLAHELGHVLGLGHPPAGADANTIMQPTGSRDTANPTRNTIDNYNRIAWPPPGNLTCIKPDA